MSEQFSPNLGMDLVRVTEAAALVAGRWMGFGRPADADHYAAEAMARALNRLNIQGTIVIGEETKHGIHSPLDSGTEVGTGNGPQMDVVVDPVDGSRLLSLGRPDAISVAGLAPRGSMLAVYPAIYMEKLVVDKNAAEAIVPECLDAPAAWTLALVARAKGKRIRDLVVFVLDRPRHRDLIDEIRQAGARVMVRTEGDIAGALMATLEDVNVDILLGIGGVAEGVISACAVKAMGGAMLARLAPQSGEEKHAVEEAGLDVTRIMTAADLVQGDDVYFAATGITDGVLLAGVRYHATRAQTESMVIRCRTGTRRRIQAEHSLADE